jgi:hypothetical protein
MPRPHLDAAGERPRPLVEAHDHGPAHVLILAQHPQSPRLPVTHPGGGLELEREIEGADDEIDL